MSDGEPEPSKNPFIRFKHHVDSRIGTGIFVLSGKSNGTDSAATGATGNIRETMDRAPNPPASPPWLAWVDPSLGSRKDALDSLLDMQHWHAWTLLSPYSPHNLRHLPQPVPAGVSSKDARLFSFGDAFEDLLAVSSGRELMDLRARAERKRSMLDLFPFPEPPMFLLDHLSPKELLPKPLPMQWMSICDKLANDIFRKPIQRLDQTEQQKNSQEMHPKKIVWPVYPHDGEKEEGCAPTAQQNARSQHKPEPDTEEDLFSAISDAFVEVGKAFLTQTFSENFHKTDVRRSTEPVEVVERDEDGSETYTKSSEHYDTLGRMHRKTEIWKVDADGNQISYETRTVVRPVSAVVTELRKSRGERENEPPTSIFENEKYNTPTVNSAKSTGWFWR